jgi:hypothetical protein
MSARFGSALLRASIGGNNAKLGTITAHPFVVAKGGPAEATAYFDARFKGVHHTAQSALEICQTPRSSCRANPIGRLPQRWSLANTPSLFVKKNFINSGDDKPARI